ncbi:HAD family hydrolase [Enterococcus sp. BWT-B8]|uniref:HAD family hydrolase n=1 Tax=unclassified Enterococcus TaxID=2608891 RepID=UPI001E3F2757|nr:MULTISPECIES: HAD family hydrolase [unclassified Enterococcus]MCB5951530.1 HAD family hydrolase [Enterococcus sp. BWT-B8]MCB5954618.1 HAD family hydrolase [Enterococcus sp. CWB-B31]
MIKGIIFDMDGVLVDSEYTFLESKTELLKDEGFPMDISYQYQFMGTTFEFMWQKMKTELSLPRSVAEYIQDMDDRRAAMIKRDGIRPIKDTVSFVRHLAESNLKMAVASSSPKREIIYNLNELGITTCFDALVSGEEVAHSKPEPDVFLEAARQIGIAPKNCLAFEDTRNGSLSVKNAGMFCVGFENPDYPAQDLSKADQIIRSFSDIQLSDLQEWFSAK